MGVPIPFIYDRDIRKLEAEAEAEVEATSGARWRNALQNTNSFLLHNNSKDFEEE